MVIFFVDQESLNRDFTFERNVPKRIFWGVYILVAWVSGVCGEKGKDGTEKGRELKERNFSPSPSPI